jgi:hypothetical protein
VWGLKRADTIAGGSGGDTIHTGPRDESAEDVVDAGEGDDIVRAFNRPASKVNCLVCGATLANPSGGEATFKGEIVARLD